MIVTVRWLPASLSLLYVLLLARPLLAQRPPGYPSINADRTEVTIDRITGGRLGQNINIDCKDATSCKALYHLESRKDRKFVPPEVDGVTRQSDSSFHVKLSDRLPSPLDGFVLVADHLEYQTGPNTYKEEHVEFALAASVFPYSRGRLRVNLLTPLYVKDLAGDAAKVEVILTDTISHAKERRTVSSIKPIPSNTPLHADDPLYVVILVLNIPIPSGSLKVTVSGLGLPEGDVTGSFKIAPQTKDKARWYLNGQFVLNHAGEDSYAIEAKASPKSWDLGSYGDLSLLVEMNVGSAALKKPDTYHAALQAGRYWTANKKLAFTLTASADYLTDKTFESQDAGGTVGLAVDLAFLQRPLRMARVLAGAQKGGKATDGDQPHWGYTVRPSASMESGVHLRSLSDHVENHAYLRARIALAALIEFDRFTFDSSAELRHLFATEVVLNNGAVVRTDKGKQGYLRNELGFTLSEILKLSAKHEWGNLPPTFKTTNATTLGVTVIY
jgi:hypothetical protein